MSTSQKVQQHPVFIQASNKANFYVQQLDKEVSTTLFCSLCVPWHHCSLLSLPLQLTKYPVLNTFEQRTQIPKSYAVLGGVVLLTLFHFVNSLAGPVSSLIGWAVPAFLSFKALESPGHQDDIQWLTYWVVFGFFNFTESIALRLVLYYFPWYFAFKTIFIIWLQLPTFRVSPNVYSIPCVPLTRVITAGCTSRLLVCPETSACKRQQELQRNGPHQQHSRQSA